MELLEMLGIVKEFPGVRANDHVNFSVCEGEIHALLGENGAGKTTLMNMLYGLYKADQGEIFWQGEKVIISSPKEAIKIGIGMVHQHFMLVNKMTVLQNILLGLKPKGYPFIKQAEITSQVRSLSEKYGLSVELDKRIDELSVGAQQRVEILKLLYRNAKLLILDEPTSVLTPQEISEFFKILQALKSEGHGIIFIAHNLSEILEISDRVTIMRDGKNVCTLQTKLTNDKELSKYMIGRELIEDNYHREEKMSTGYVLEVKDLSLGDDSGKFLLKDIDLCIHKQEVLGIAGVDGNGQRELAEVIIGIRRQSKGSIFYNGKNIDRQNIRNRAEGGMAYIPADRHNDGLILDASVMYNLHLKNYYKVPYANKSVLNFRRMQALSTRKVLDYDIKTPNIYTNVRLLSGGNQQKLILAREIDESTNLTIACQPTRGLDIGATEHLRMQLMNCRNHGGSVLLISTDLAEIIAMSDRIAVMYNGRIMGVLENDEYLSVETLGLMMGGQTFAEIISCAKN